MVSYFCSNWNCQARIANAYAKLPTDRLVPLMSLDVDLDILRAVFPKTLGELNVLSGRFSSIRSGDRC